MAFQSHAEKDGSRLFSNAGLSLLGFSPDTKGEGKDREDAGSDAGFSENGDEARPERLNWAERLSLAGRSENKRSSMVGADVQNAWMTRGWTLTTACSRHNHFGLGENCTKGLRGDAVVDRPLQETVNIRQQRLSELTKVNKQLQGSLVRKKQAEQELRTKIEVLAEKLQAACGVEKCARELSEATLEERILTEEREKQDMQLALSQRIRECEERIAKVRAENESSQKENGQNKKVMKEQQAQIKERQKAIRHLERQIHVLEGVRKSEQAALEGDQAIPEHGLPKTGRERKQSFNDADEIDGDGMLHSQRVKACATADSKGLLRGARAEKHLEEEKKRLKEQRLQTLDLTSKNAARTMAEIRSLPGLDLNRLLGVPNAEPKEKEPKVPISPR